MDGNNSQGLIIEWNQVDNFKYWEPISFRCGETHSQTNAWQLHV